MKYFSELLILLVVIVGFSLVLEGKARATCSDFETDDHLSCQDHCTVWNSGSSLGLTGTFPNRMLYQRLGFCRCWLWFSNDVDGIQVPNTFELGSAQCDDGYGTIITGSSYDESLGEEAESLGVEIDARRVTLDNNCAFKLNLADQHAIQNLIIVVSPGKRNKAFCDSQGNDLYVRTVTSQLCSTGNTRNCEFDGTTVIEREGCPAKPGDLDGDCWEGAEDNCPAVYNFDQANGDGDGFGDTCDPFADDHDNDTVPDSQDLCPTIPARPGEEDDHRCVSETRCVGSGRFQICFPVLGSCRLTLDSDRDGYPNSCDPDDDNDGICDGGETVDYGIGARCHQGNRGYDNCPSVANGNNKGEENQRDDDGDGIGNICDPFPGDSRNDEDSDGRGADIDNCPSIDNEEGGWADTDADGAGDACDIFTDSDHDGVQDLSDECFGTSSGVVVLANGCPDLDGDSVSDNHDNCVATPAGTLVDIHGCPVSGPVVVVDTDGDSIVDSNDDCPGTPAGTAPAMVTSRGCLVEVPGETDDDGDGVLNLVDQCPGTAAGMVVVYNGCEDADQDSVPDNTDTCLGTTMGAVVTTDGCTLEGDSDFDGILDGADLCPSTMSTQIDTDGDLTGDECDPDADGDGKENGLDNCPRVANADQADTDQDGIGDLCEGSAFTTDSDGDNILDIFDCAPMDRELFTLPACYGDSDSDGLTDTQEAERGTDPVKADTDDDGILDALDCAPKDGAAGNCAEPAPVNVDPDGDGTGIGDNCPFAVNADQKDTDNDGIGDTCDPTPSVSSAQDTDGDGLVDDQDNCPLVPNSDQSDIDGDKTGDRCQGDRDGDGSKDALDNCPSNFNMDQADDDGNGLGNACDENFSPSLSLKGGGGGCSLIPDRS